MKENAFHSSNYLYTKIIWYRYRYTDAALIFTSSCCTVHSALAISSGESDSSSIVPVVVLRG